MKIYTRVKSKVFNLELSGSIFDVTLLEFLYTHDRIEDVQVVGVPDSKVSLLAPHLLVPRKSASPYTHAAVPSPIHLR